MSMLGRFLELSLVVPDTGTSWQRWLGLGFAGAEAGDIWPHAYGVVACEGVAVGLHAAGGESPFISFVRPEVAQLERELADRLLGVEHARLGDDEFNLIELREPGGTLLRVQEARTFSAPAEVPARTSLGVFDALSLPCPDLAEARGFWERLGYEVRDIEQPWPGLAVESLPLACHEVSTSRDVLLVFDGPVEAGAIARLGIAPARLPALRHRAHSLLHVADGVGLLGLAPG
jgi:hypothetical protein